MNATIFSLAEVADCLNVKILDQFRNLTVSHITCASKECRPGSVFVAIPGSRTDGHQFIPDAFSRGASAAVIGNAAFANADRPTLQVSDTKCALSALADLIYGSPSKDLLVTGVTGTNGKTTVQWLISELLTAAGAPCIAMGTLGIRMPDITTRESLTTPDALSVQSALREALDRGMQHCVMEVSSHGLAQRRVEHVHFDVAVFTNLTRDHLDFHRDFDDYFSAKRELFRLCAHGAADSLRAAVINRDDPFGARLHAELKPLGLNDFSFSMKQSAGAYLTITGFEQDFAGSTTRLHCEGRNFTLRTKMIGAHNARNIAAAFAAARALNIDADAIVEKLPQLPPVPGRLEPLGNAALGVYVDYAHTPDALDNVLCALRDLTPGKLWVVFGCGGDRDRGKRPEMARVAGRLADHIVITSDNPRSEDPQRIIDDILSSGVAVRIIEPDRKRALEAVLAAAAPGDTVLVAGKGHEDYQILSSGKIHFSDQEEVRRIMGDLARNRQNH